MERKERYLTFFAGEEFGVNVRCVSEIAGMEEIWQASNQPEWVKGMINLRGTVIPVVDLRRKLNFMVQEPTPRTCIVIARVDSNLIGFIVDGINELITLGESDMVTVDDAAPQGVVGIGNTKPTGRVKVSRSVKLLDLEAVLTAEDRKTLTVA